jgi:hypothetical protein
MVVEPPSMALSGCGGICQHHRRGEPEVVHSPGSRGGGGRRRPPHPSVAPTAQLNRICLIPVEEGDQYWFHPMDHQRDGRRAG